MPLSNEHYLNHIASVNEHNQVVLSEDVLNERGVLVVKKGTEVSREFALKIAKHKLIKPIDESISLAQKISYEQMHDSYVKHLNKLSMADVVKKAEGFNEVSLIFKSLFKYPLVTQKLAILEDRMPDVFVRTLNASVLALGVCKELKLSPADTENVFVASMISDVGLLHIDPNIVHKKGKYSPKEWKLMQGHVAIVKHFADQVPGLPPIVSKALLEHHERADGLGYPFGKKGDKLCIEGQILSIVDSVMGLSQKLIYKQSYSWNALLHIMQMPSTEHQPTVQKAMIRLLKKLQFQHTPAYKHEEYQVIAKECAIKRKRLKLWFIEFEKIYTNHQSIVDSNEFDALGLLQSLEHTVHDIGILNDAQDKWLKGLTENIAPSEYSELEEYVLLLDEVKFRCYFVMREFQNHKEDLAKRLGNMDLLMAYYEGLNNILPFK